MNFRSDQPSDWWVFTGVFIVLPHFLRSFLTLCSQNWPVWDWKRLIFQRDFSQIQENLKQIANFKWCQILQSLPVIHLFKRLHHFYLLFKSSDLTPTLSLIEEETLYCVTFHSGPQITLQLCILFQLNQGFLLQRICLIQHTFYALRSASNFYFTQRSQAQYSKPYLPTFPCRKIITTRIIIWLLLIPIFLPRLYSFGLLFSYAKTFISVPIIVLFGISYMALFYDQFVANFPKIQQFLMLCISGWMPCVPGFKKHYLFINALSNLALHFLCHVILLIHICSIQQIDVKYLPLTFHCFPTNVEQIQGHFCKVNHRQINFESCQEQQNSELSQAQMCLPHEYANMPLIASSITVLILQVISLMFSYMLNKLADEKRLKIVDEQVNCQRGKKEQGDCVEI